MKKVYISGKITGTDDYIQRFERAERTLAEKGHVPVNPARVCAELPNIMDYEDYMRVAFALLDCCDAIYMLDGWADSKGATAEHFYACSMGKELMYEEEGRKEMPLNQEPVFADTKKRKLLDYGKIRALYNAGWKVKDIALDMDVSPKSVDSAIQIMKKKGIIV